MRNVRCVARKMGNTCRNAANHCLQPAAVIAGDTVLVVVACFSAGTGSLAMVAFRFSVSSERSVDECIYTPILSRLQGDRGSRKACPFPERLAPGELPSCFRTLAHYAGNTRPLNSYPLL